MRAVIYCRVSTKEQRENLSLPTQLRACQEYCERQGFEVARAFEDAGESAKTTDRPDFQRLLEYCRLNKGRVQFVVVYNVTRFSRNAHAHAVVRALLQRLGVSLRSVNEPITDDSVGKLTENMLAAIAQFDNDQKSERTKAGMRAAGERGRWTWLAPLGYVNGNTRAGEPSLVPDKCAPLIVKAFELMASAEYGVNGVLRLVTALGLRSRTGRALTPQTCGTMLRNRIYAGYINAPGLGIKDARGDFEPLISVELFERVQWVLKGGSKAPATYRPENPEFPLRRFVSCGLCGLPLTGSSPKGRSRTYPYYHCRKCKGVRVAARKLESEFVNLLERLQPKPALMKLFRAIVLDVWQSRHVTAERLLGVLAEKLAGLRRREALLEEAFIYEKRIGAATYERQRDKLREEIALARIELEDAKLEEIDLEGVLGFAEHVLTNAARLWVEAQPEQKQLLQRVLFPEGLRLQDWKFGTAVTCFAFTQLTGIGATESGLASPAGFATCWTLTTRDEWTRAA